MINKDYRLVFTDVFNCTMFDSTILIILSNNIGPAEDTA